MNQYLYSNVCYNYLKGKLGDLEDKLIIDYSFFTIPSSMPEWVFLSR